MRRLLFVLCLLIAVVPHFVRAQATEPATRASTELSLRDAIILGVVEGVTEYLPVSSTGHLIIANHALGLDTETPLHDEHGQPLWYKKPSEKYPGGVPLTLKTAADTYAVIIQFGAIAAVAFLYWSQLVSMLKGLFGRDRAGLTLLIQVLIAFLPAAVIGLMVHDWIDEHLFSINTVILALVAGAVLMVAAERYRRARTQRGTAVHGELTHKKALAIGFMQCLAMWPGTSRSMMTIVAGYFVGLDPRKAAEFSFILGFVTLSAATLFKSLTGGAAMIEVFGWTEVIVGCVVAALTALVAVKFFVGFLTRHGLMIFAYYRLALAIVLALIFHS